MTIFILIIMGMFALIFSVSGGLLLFTFVSTLNLQESFYLVNLEIYTLFNPEIKYQAYQQAHKEKMRSILTEIASTKDKVLLQNNYELSMDDVKKIKIFATEKLQNKTYQISEEQAKQILKELGQLNFFYSLQTMVQFYSNPKRQSNYEKIKTSSKKQSNYKKMKKSSKDTFYTLTSNKFITVSNTISLLKRRDFSFA